MPEHESNDLYRQLLDSFSDPVFCFDKDCRYLYANRAFADGIARNLDEIIGRTVWDIFSQDQADKRAALVKLAFDHAQVRSHEILVRGRDGERYYLTTLTPVFGDQCQVSSVLANSKDITERKQAEAALSESESFLRVVIDSVPDQIAVIDQDGVIVRVNEPWRRFSLENSPEPGKPVPHTEVGTNYIDVCRVCTGSDAEGSNSAREGIQAVLDGRLADFSMEYPCHSPDHQRWFAMRVSPLEGKQRGAVIAHTNITERKQAEAELIQHRDHLEELVADRTSELAQSRDAAEAGNRAKTIFLANMSHELRTPMSGVMGMIDLVLRRVTDPRQIDMLRKSKDAAQHMVNVVNDIIDFSKAEAEGLPLEEKNFSLSQMIDDAIAMHKLSAMAKGLYLRCEVPADFPEQLSGDSFRVRQILLNFLGNACKFSEQGTIAVRVRVLQQDGASVLARLEVEDQGIGISAEQQASLFQAFTQADDSLTRKHGGSGLGLVISQRLARLMGGDVGVVSQEGRGSTFWATVRLRLVDASEVKE